MKKESKQTFDQKICPDNIRPKTGTSNTKVILLSVVLENQYVPLNKLYMKMRNIDNPMIPV